MNKKILVLSLCTLLIFTTGCGSKNNVKLKNGKEVVAEIEGYEVTAEDLFNKLKEQTGSQTLINMIDEYIVNKEITDSKEANEYAKSQLESIKTQYKNSGMDFEEALASAGYENEGKLKESLALDYKKSEVVKSFLRDELTDEEIKKYYDENIFGEQTVKHILIAPDTNDDMTDKEKEKAENKAKTKAEDIIKKLNDGKKFEDMVKKYSDDTGSVSDGGLISDFTKDSVVEEFWDASYKLKDGEYTKEPVKSEYGYHIILKVSSTKKPSLKSVKDDVKDELVDQKLNEDSNLSTTTWVKIRKKYKLNISDSTLKNDYQKSTEK